METKKMDLRRVLVYVLVTFGLTWGYCLLIVYPLANGEALNGIPSLATQLLVAAAMFFPSIGVLLTRLITKEAAVYGPLAVTAVCLLTMLLSRKTLYPWIICLFSMVLPVLILITNMFPA